jgi:hypothetical protein
LGLLSKSLINDLPRYQMLIPSTAEQDNVLAMVGFHNEFNFGKHPANAVRLLAAMRYFPI